MASSGQRRGNRSRSNTLRSFQERHTIEEEPASPPSPEPRPSIKSHRTVSTYASQASAEPTDYQTRPGYTRATTFEGPTQLRREPTTQEMPRFSRAPSDNLSIRTLKSQLRPTSFATPQESIFDQDDSAASSPDRSYRERSVSPATSHSSVPARSVSGTPVAGGPGAKKGPPPPPPSRAKKPPPPPPPAKRGILT